MKEGFTKFRLIGCSDCVFVKSVPESIYPVKIGLLLSSEITTLILSSLNERSLLAVLVSHGIETLA
jgi:hypothetical protein